MRAPASLPITLTTPCPPPPPCLLAPGPTFATRPGARHRHHFCYTFVVLASSLLAASQVPQSATKFPLHKLCRPPLWQCGWCVLSDRGIAPLAHFSPLLTQLDLSGCAQLTDRGARTPLSLHNDEVSSAAVYLEHPAPHPVFSSILGQIPTPCLCRLRPSESRRSSPHAHPFPSLKASLHSSATARGLTRCSSKAAARSPAGRWLVLRRDCAAFRSVAARS